MRKLCPIQLAIIVGIAMVGCDGAGSSVERTSICDASPRLRLRAHSSPNGLLGDENEFLGRSGGVFLQLDGTCTAWVAYSPSVTAAAVRTLTIDDEGWPSFQRRLRLASWDDLAGTYPQPEIDAAIFDWESDTAMLRCFGSCTSSPLAGLREETFFQNGVIEELWDSGIEIAEGPIEFMVVQDPGVEPVGEWPLEIEPADVEGLAQARLVEDSDPIATQLRELRATHSTEFLEYGSISFNAEGDAYILYIRDVIPFENAAVGDAPLP